MTNPELFQHAVVLLVVAAAGGVVVRRALSGLKPGGKGPCGCAGCPVSARKSDAPAAQAGGKSVGAQNPTRFFIPSVGIGLRRSTASDKSQLHPPA